MTSSRMPVRPLLFALTLLVSMVVNVPLLTGGAHASPVNQNDPVIPNTDQRDLSTLAVGFADPTTCQTFDPISRYGSILQFQIRRNDAPVGRHIVQFNRGRDGLQVIAQTNIDISFFGFTAYSFRYRSESLWQNGQLAVLSVNVDDDGDISSVTATHDQTGMLVSGPDGIETLPSGIFPTDHWHCGVLGSASVLNTITGKPNDVGITAKPDEMLRTTNGVLRATQFTYDGDLKTNAWYDHEGRWVGLQFKARDGSDIIYRCVNCMTQTAFEDRG
ncbi:MAG: hypothetical protein KTR23_16365 [Rhodospirillales bacterium]|nr:hypothetical protein [Rhodospirillales bacterium]